jgi:hypothetical protein
MQIQTAGTPINLSASGAISLCPGSILGFYVNATSGGTLVIANGGASGTAITGTITPAIGWHEFPAAITSTLGAYATIAVAALNVTFIFAAGG